MEYSRLPRIKKPEVVQRRCYRCHGTGRAPCQGCGGSGRMTTSRDALGNVQAARCPQCYGNKVSRCRTCGGTGMTD